MGEGYTPTLGMIRALAEAVGALEGDYRRCQRRGLLDWRLRPTVAGRFLIQRLAKRGRERADA